MKTVFNIFLKAFAENRFHKCYFEKKDEINHPFYSSSGEYCFKRFSEASEIGIEKAIAPKLCA